jgi:hypothetical protein
MNDRPEWSWDGWIGGLPWECYALALSLLVLAAAGIATLT